MKIQKIEINNFRSIKHALIDCEAYNSFVGSNGSGKSTVLNALNLFFGEISNFSESDFHARNTDKDIEVTITFYDFSEHAKEEFKHYIRNEKLVVTASVQKKEDGTFKKTVVGERLVFKAFSPFFDLPSSPASDRTNAFNKIREQFPNLAKATSGTAREKVLRDYEESLQDSDKELTKSGEEFFGVSKGVHKFQRHINWVYVPAVKDASTESEEVKTSHLGKLIQHTIRSRMDYEDVLQGIKDKAMASYTELLRGQKSHLSDLEARLSEKLKSGITTDAKLELDWKKDEKSVSISSPIAQVLLNERGFSGEVESFGHGLQRSFLIVILQELMSIDSEVSPTLLLGCEEPELYQHPPQAKHLASILAELAEGDAQVFISTHSPYFINVDYYDGIKRFENLSNETKITRSSFASIMESYNQAFEKPLQNEDQARAKLSIQTQPKYNEVFFSDKVVLVEGISDQSCLETYLRLSGKYKDFRNSGVSIVVCEGKSSLVLLLLILNSFSIPVHVIFDCDSSAQGEARGKHQKDNTAIFSLVGLDIDGGFPNEHVLQQSVTAWVQDIEDVLEDEFGDDAAEYAGKGHQAVGHLSGCKKNPLYVATVISEAWNAGKRFETLETVTANILS